MRGLWESLVPQCCVQRNRLTCVCVCLSVYDGKRWTIFQQKYLTITIHRAFIQWRVRVCRGESHRMGDSLEPATKSIAFWPILFTPNEFCGRNQCKLSSFRKLYFERKINDQRRVATHTDLLSRNLFSNFIHSFVRTAINNATIVTLLFCYMVSVPSDKTLPPCVWRARSECRCVRAIIMMYMWQSIAFSASSKICARVHWIGIEQLK